MTGLLIAYGVIALLFSFAAWIVHDMPEDPTQKNTSGGSGVGYGGIV